MGTGGQGIGIIVKNEIRVGDGVILRCFRGWEMRVFRGVWGAGSAGGVVRNECVDYAGYDVNCLNGPSTN